MRPKPQSPRSASDVAGIADPGEGMRPADRGQPPAITKSSRMTRSSSPFRLARDQVPSGGSFLLFGRHQLADGDAGGIFRPNLAVDVAREEVE